ncbi:MAG TPA: hypothetical protein VL334_07210 [Anaerolineae bacterium]|nr:hypothetical protein [Anaerolineae bacterium]
MTVQAPAQSQVNISQVVRNAVQFNARRWRNRPMNSDLMPQAVGDLFRLLDQRGIDYVLVGGIALLSYVEGRNTEDIDLIVAAASLDKLPEIRITSRDMYFARGQLDGLQIDFLLTSNPLFERVRRQHVAVQHFGERDVPTATVEGLLLLKLYALPSLYREGNFARVGLYENDVATLLHYYEPDKKAVLHELAAYLSDSNLAEVRSILAEIELRIQRFRG